MSTRCNGKMKMQIPEPIIQNQMEYLKFVLKNAKEKHQAKSRHEAVRVCAA